MLYLLLISQLLCVISVSFKERVLQLLILMTLSVFLFSHRRFYLHILIVERTYLKVSHLVLGKFTQNCLSLKFHTHFLPSQTLNEVFP
jgi:hypothetical protein